MALSDEQIERYSRHIILKEVGAKGQKKLLNAKVLIIDDQLCSIGSANMDFRSFEHNFEINAFVYQASFAKQMKKVFQHDMLQCDRLIPSVWLKRPLKQRLSESFMRLFSPLL